MTRDEMLSEIASAFDAIAGASERFPADPALRDSSRMLADLRDRVRAQWPLPRAEAQAVNVGLFAVRNLEPDMPEVVTALVRVERLLQSGGERQSGSSLRRPPQF